VTPAAHLSAVTELLAHAESYWSDGIKKPADALVAEFFRGRRYIGSKDRATIASLFYFIIRRKAALSWLAHQSQHAASPRVLTMLGAAFHQSLDLAAVEALHGQDKYAPAPLTPTEKAMLGAALQRGLSDPAMPPHIRTNTPEWLHAKITEAYEDTAPALLDALMEEAPIDIRVNTLKAAPKQLTHALKKEGIHHANPMTYAPNGLRLKKREALFALQSFRDGWFEVQDEGSQLVAAFVDAQPKQRIIDFCAGAGGKTLAIAAHMNNTGRILAFDVHSNRLEEAAKRFRRAGVHNAETKLITSETDGSIKRHKRSADWVLVDAPCTGTGTWRRSPDLKWRTTEADLAELVALQRRILASAARLVKEGGTLVYATCSLLPEENSEQIAWFLSENPDFNPSPASLASLPAAASFQLTPSTHGTDGFFVARMQRLADTSITYIALTNSV
jgi:16S rRNA (cytosine967-C5)-methyltransferase